MTSSPSDVDAEGGLAVSTARRFRGRRARRAVRDRLEDRQRQEARLAILRTFLPHEIPTADEQRALVAFWNREGPPPPAPRPRRR